MPNPSQDETALVGMLAQRESHGAATFCPVCDQCTMRPDGPEFHSASCWVVAARLDLAALRERVDEKAVAWIPVGERLPAEGERVLITGIDGNDIEVHITTYWDYGHGEGEWRDDHGYRCWPSAWRPLPALYVPPTGDPHAR